jgi:nucleotide-binding universal stress UspA family protein
MEALLVLLVAWITTGLIIAVAMRRRGHRLVPWLVMGAAFGPLTASLAGDAAAHEGEIHPELLDTGDCGPGQVDVLVGCDGSAHSEAALSRVVELLGDRICRLTLATVVDYDTAGGGKMWDHVNASARATLATSASRSPVPVTSTVVLNGAAADALAGYAATEGYDVLVAGTRGHGLSRAVLGSVAARLSRVTGVPVLLVGGHGAADGPDPAAGRTRTVERSA